MAVYKPKVYPSHLDSLNFENMLEKNSKHNHVKVKKDALAKLKPAFNRIIRIFISKAKPYLAPTKTGTPSRAVTETSL